MKELFNTIFFNPLYNALIALIDVVPYADVGIAVVILTIIVKLILFPLSIKAVRTQVEMKIIQEPMEELKKKYKDDREKLGRAMLELYKEHKINPFSGFLLVLIQIPVILALYWVFLRGGLPDINFDILYSFVPVPEAVKMNFLGLIDIHEPRSVLLALTAAVSQFFQARLSFPKAEPIKEGSTPSLKDDMMKGMSFQVKYILPIFIFGISYTLVSAVALYWTVSNLFSIGQELYVRAHVRKPDESKVASKKEDDEDED